MKFFEELKRRNVFRVGVAYLVAAWLLLQVADVVLSLLNLPQLVGQIILMVLSFGFIPAIILAWAYELTPDGIKREKDIDSSESATRETGRTLDRIILATVVLAVAFLIVDRYFLSGTAVDSSTVGNEPSEINQPEVEESPSVAVLPFLNLSGNVENEYFSDGLTETLLHMLAQLPSLRVAARTSSFAFKGQNTDIREIAEILGVAHVLEGSVQRVGERVRVTAQLIRADDGFHVWSQNYDRTLDDIFAIQDEIAVDVASSLSSSLLQTEPILIEGVSTTNIQVYDNYLKALEKFSIRSFTSLGEAEILLKTALAGDPGFFEAKVALARTYFHQYVIGVIDKSVGVARMESTIAQLLLERPENPATRSLDILLRFQDQWDSGDYSEIENMLPEIYSVLEEAPHESDMRMVAAGILNMLGSPELAIQVVADGLVIDPLDLEMHIRLGVIYEWLERFDEAEAEFLKAHQLAAENPGPPSLLALLSGRKGEVIEKFNWLRKAVNLDPLDHEFVGHIAELFYQFGFLESGDYWAARGEVLAANSPAYRGLQLRRAVATDDQEHIMLLARAILKDNLPDRKSVFTNALQNYVMIMQERGQSKQALDELEDMFEGVSEFAQADDSYSVILMKMRLMWLWKEIAPPGDYLQRYEMLVLAIDEKGIPWRDTPWIRGILAALRDDHETAASSTAEVLDSWDVTSHWWIYFETRNRFSRLLTDPAVARRFAKFKSEKAHWQEEIKKMLQQPEWAM